MWGDYLILQPLVRCWFRPRHAVVVGGGDGGDYSRLLEHPSEKALQRRYYAKHPAISKVLFVRVEPPRTRHLVSRPSVSPFSGGGKQGFMEDVYQLAFPNINSKQMIRMPKRECVCVWGRNRCRAVHRGTGTDGFVSSMAVVRMNDFLSNKRLVSVLSLRWRGAAAAASEDWNDENIYMFQPASLFLFFNQWWSQRPAVILSSHSSGSLPIVRHLQSPQLERGWWWWRGGGKRWLHPSLMWRSVKQE